MSKKWEIKSISEICQNLDKKRIPITKSKRQKGNIPYYGASGIVDYVANFIFDEDLLLVSEDGANLLARTYPIAFSIAGKTWVNNHAHVLKFDSFNSQKYIEYYLNSINLEPFVSGMAQPKLNQRSLNSITVPFPSLPEQKQIVKILDKTFADIDLAIANTEKNLANARELFDSYLNNIFTQKGEGWEEKKLPDISENLDRKRIPITKNKRNKGDIPYYGASGIVDHVLDYIFDEELLLISEDGANLLARTYPIAFSISGKSWVNNHAHVLRFEQKFMQKYVEYYLNSISLVPFVSGMAQPKLNQTSLNSITVPLPPKEQLILIVEKLEILENNIKKLVTVFELKRRVLTELKQSILQKAFTGELTKDFSTH